MGVDRREPANVAGGGVAGKQPRRPPIVAVPLHRVPRRRVTRGVDQQSKPVIEDETAGAAAALAPPVRRPCRHAEIPAVADTDIGIGPGVEPAPDGVAGGRVQSLDPPARAEIIPGAADEQCRASQDRRRPQRLAQRGIGGARVPSDGAARSVERHRVAVERVEVQTASGNHRSGCCRTVPVQSSRLSPRRRRERPPDRIVRPR